MCGLFGWNFKRRSHVDIGKRECLAASLALCNSTRGDKSWGVYATSKDRPDGFIHKVADDISKASGFSVLGRLPLVMAHTRAPTQGKICERNAHPFKVGSVILSHNGVINNSDELDKKYKRNVEVDSLHLAMHLSEGKDFKDIEGYGAVTWNRVQDPNTVFLCRMRSGSLSVYGIKNGSGEQVGVAWSSDSHHLKDSIGMARLDAFPYKDLGEGAIFYVNRGKLYSSEDKLEISAPSYRSYYGMHGGTPAVSHAYGNWSERGYFVLNDDGDTYSWFQKEHTLYVSSSDQD